MKTHIFHARPTVVSAFFCRHLCVQRIWYDEDGSQFPRSVLITSRNEYQLHYPLYVRTTVRVFGQDKYCEKLTKIVAVR